MTDAAPTFAQFDIVQVLMGRDYPTVEVPFYLNEAAAFALSRAEKRLDDLKAGVDANENDRTALDQEINTLKEKVRATRYVYHLKGIPAKVRNDLLDLAFKKYPREADPTSIFGAAKDNDERDEFFGKLLLHAMTEKIVDPNGAVMVNPTIEQVEQFRDHAPDAALAAIALAQRELTEGTKSGFEIAAQDTDFSSAP